MNLIYDPTVEVSCPLYVCPECHSRFYSGGRALHEKGCSNQTCEGVEVHFGDKQVKAVVSKAASFGDDMPCFGITMNDLKTHFPELVMSAA